MAGIGVPLKLLYEAHGLIVSIELETGQTYRGKLVGIEDNMNVQLRDVTITHRDGHITLAEGCFLRGSHIRFFSLPDNLRHSPIFKNFTRKDKSRGMGATVARSEVARVQASNKTFLPLIVPSLIIFASLFLCFSAWRKGFFRPSEEMNARSSLASTPECGWFRTQPLVEILNVYLIISIVLILIHGIIIFCCSLPGDIL